MQVKQESGQQEERALDLVIIRNPAERCQQGRISDPEDGCRDGSHAGAGQPAHDQREQDQVGSLRCENSNVIRQRIRFEQFVEKQKEAALAPGADGTLRHGREHSGKKTAKRIDLCVQPQPGEIVLFEPVFQAVPVDGKKESNRQENEDRVGERSLPKPGVLRSTYVQSRQPWQLRLIRGLPRCQPPGIW